VDASLGSRSRFTDPIVPHIVTDLLRDFFGEFLRPVAGVAEHVFSFDGCQVHVCTYVHSTHFVGAVMSSPQRATGISPAIGGLTDLLEIMNNRVVTDVLVVLRREDRESRERRN